MAKILIDVNGWQSLFDFKTGESMDDDLKKPYIALAAELADEYPYPGDMSLESISWVTASAVNVFNKYEPDFMFLSYATPNLKKIHEKLTDEEYKELNKLAVSEALLFAETTGMTPIIVSTGNMKKFDKILNFDDIDGYVGTSSFDQYIAGVFSPSEGDYERLKQKPGIHITANEDFCASFPGMTEETKAQIPEILIEADSDYAFTQTGYRGITMQALQAKELFCGAYSPYEDLPNDIFEFRAFIDKKLDEGEKVVLIVVESVEDDDMPIGTKRISREKSGISYSEGGGFYYALCSAAEVWELGTSHIFHNAHHTRQAKTVYPFSYVKGEDFKNPIGLRPDKRTAAVGTRSGITHSVLMCDYTLECHSRGLAESGVLVFINDKLDK